MVNVMGLLSRCAASLATRGRIAWGRTVGRVDQDEVAGWVGDTQLFFVLAMGRSGTAFLSSLLDQAPDAHVVHEPVRSDFAGYVTAYYSEALATAYVRDYRSQEIARRLRGTRTESYGEVNGTLRRHTDAIRRVFPEAVLIHLIRDGRDVVRSIMGRNAFTSRDPTTMALRPKEETWRAAWPRMSRFEKVCWYWQVENRYLRNRIERTVQFERLISDYAYFRDALLAPLGLEIPESIWRSSIHSPRNVTTRHRMPHWSAWDRDQRATFERICGAEMAANGYDPAWAPPPDAR